ncbi:hypothetical protein [Streptomyces spirodelae]|nr:hypothetical protein [Streptomyces spirodelae]
MDDEEVSAPPKPPWSSFERWSIILAMSGVLTAIISVVAQFAMR